MRCIWCDDFNHKQSDCKSFIDAIKKGIITFKEGRIRDASIDFSLNTNFGKGRMKKLMENQLVKPKPRNLNNANFYQIVAWQNNVEASYFESCEIIIKEAQAIRKRTGWNDLVDAVSIKTFLNRERKNEDFQDVFVEAKRGRNAKQEEEPISKRQIQKCDIEDKTNKDQSLQNILSSLQSKEISTLKKKVGEKMDKGKNKKDEKKDKIKGPIYKLQFDIESFIDLKGILEEWILDAKIDFTL